jgi:EAL domain-containing protein (putative c-di-GMP-specific phosphodiesterase class I)/FixJ family two-component response regulator
VAYSVLVVEDHPFQQRHLLDLYGSMHDISLMAARNGDEALTLMKTHHFDMVLSDLMMPGMDGLQFIQRLGHLPYKPALAIMSSASRRIMISASLAARSLGFEVVGLISKPVDLIALRTLHDKMLKLGASAHAHKKMPQEFGIACLRHAIADGQIHPWFQPKKSIASDRIVAAEALVRWAHPTLGVLLPGDFLSELVRHNLEEELLMSVVSRTIAAQACWQQQGYDVPVTINLPTHLLNDDDLPDRLYERVLSEGGFPTKIGFELMESSTTDNQGHYFAGVCRLRFKGFGLAQDDFGKGYSSYFNLASTPFTELKIDRSLVHGSVENEHLAAALSSIVALGRQLGLNVVAEGVETAEELALLKRMHCDQIQGFLISKAIESDLFLRLLGENTRAHC